ncbi:Na+/glucose cotransporter, partial [bacterium]|nr:Na+/glucose cotransporter [bacterium]
LMSSLAGVFNASSTLFTMDLYSKFDPKATQEKLVWIGRFATAVMVIIGLMWVPVIQGARGLYDYLQGVQGYIAPPIFVVFFIGVFMKRANSAGSLATLIIGFLLGVFRLAIDTPVKLKMAGFEDGYTEGTFYWFINNVYFQYYSLFIFLVCVVTMIGVSLLTPAPDEQRISGLTYGTVSADQRAVSRSSWDVRDVVASVLVLVLILAAYVYFSG